MEVELDPSLRPVDASAPAPEPLTEAVLFRACRRPLVPELVAPTALSAVEVEMGPHVVQVLLPISHQTAALFSQNPSKCTCFW